MNLLKIGLILMAVTIFIFACAENKKTNSNNVVANVQINATTNIQPTATMDETASAKKIYVDNCAKCHKEDGTGGKVVIDGETIKATNLTSERSKKDNDEEIFGNIKDGVVDEGMPAFKNKLSDEEIKNVVKFIRKDLQGK